MFLLLSDNASPGSLDGMMPGFLVEEGGWYGKIGNCSDITYFTYWESGPKTRDSFVYINNNNDVDNFIIVRIEEFSSVISVENALYLNNGCAVAFHISRYASNCLAVLLLFVRNTLQEFLDKFEESPAGLQKYLSTGLLLGTHEKQPDMINKCKLLGPVFPQQINLPKRTI